MSSIFSGLTEGDIRRVAILLFLIFFNFIFAVVGSLMRGGFNPANGGLDPKKLPEFIYKHVLPYIVGFAFFEVFLHFLPPSQMATTLFDTKPTTLIDISGVDVSKPWAWLDPAVLWIGYSSIVVMLVKQVFSNLVYVFGRGLQLAQSAAAK